MQQNTQFEIRNSQIFYKFSPIPTLQMHPPIGGCIWGVGSGLN